MPPRFNKELDFEYGADAEVSPLLRRVVAPNPSAFTFHGTGTYIVGRGSVAVIDPGPADESHVEALKTALADEVVSHIVVTHTHIDHSPAAAALKAHTGAATWGYGPHGSGSNIVVEAGGDIDFVPDNGVVDGQVIAGEGWTLEAVHTPGHTSNHLCFALNEEEALFSGDHVMGWSTTVVSPPDGDMAAYIASLRKVAARPEQRYYPTHGAPIDNASSFVGKLVAHRQQRERQIATCLDEGVTRIPHMVSRLYANIDSRLHGAAGRSVLAHLVHMVATGRAACDGAPDIDTEYRSA
jgi:glyoxylase-like metal-dependent hydrolase (beta-lactamase superfamily II)